MARINDEVASAFSELAELLELADADFFRIASYRRAAATIGTLAQDLRKMSEVELKALKGVGKATAAKVAEFLETGTFQALEDARKEVPPGLIELTSVAGLGPRKARQLHEQLGVSSLEDLKAAIDNESIKELAGFGPKTQSNLREALKRRESSDRTPFAKALSIAEEFVEALGSLAGVGQVVYAGSLRRMKDSIGDIDLLATADDAGPVMQAFVGLPKVIEVLAQGQTRSTVLVRGGLQVDLRVVGPDEFGSALQYFTGSKEHNVKVRERAVKRGFKLSEYGLFKVEGEERVAGATEDGIYSALGMQTPPAPMREDAGEIELAVNGELPNLLKLSDIKGDLHVHTTASDGRSSLDEMADAAAAMGYAYLAITDHWGSRWRVDREVIALQREKVETIKARLKGQLDILLGVEASIGRDASLSLADEDLSVLDFVIASIHERFGGHPDETTQRLLEVLDHPKVAILGHPTARRIGRRPSVEFDLDQVFGKAAKVGVALEVNSTPDRLDLPSDHIHVARRHGCRFVVNTDAHSPLDFQNIRFGVGVAQRGWLTAADVINAQPFEELRRVLVSK